MRLSLRSLRPTHSISCLVLVSVTAVGCGTSADPGAESECSDPTVACIETTPSEAEEAVAGEIQSNTPQATFDITTNISGLRLLNSAFKQERIGSDYYHLWMAEVTNDGPDFACYVKAYTSLLDDSGDEFVADEAFLYSGQYADAEGNNRTCLGPGDKGVLFDNYFGKQGVDVPNLARIRVKMVGRKGYGLVAYPNPPELKNLALGYTIARGSITAHEQLAEVWVQAFAVDPNGLLREWVWAENRGGMAKGGTWQFESSEADSAIREARVFVSFTKPKATSASGTLSTQTSDADVHMARWQAVMQLRSQAVGLARP